MLKEFDQAFEDFERDAYSKLYECHFDAGKELDNFNLQVQAQSLANDLGYFCLIVRDLYEETLGKVSQEMDRKAQMAFEPIRDSSGRDPTVICLGKLGVVYKAFYFLVRAFHDVLYKMILCLHGQNVGPKSSMKDAIDYELRSLKRTNPVGEFISNCCEGYAEWFIPMRARRDLSKYGVGISYEMGKNFVNNETSLAIKIGNPTRNQSPALTLDEFTKSLTISTQITNAMIKYGLTTGRFISPNTMLNPDAQKLGAG